MFALETNVYNRGVSVFQSLLNFLRYVQSNWTLVFPSTHLDVPRIWQWFLIKK